MSDQEDVDRRAYVERMSQYGEAITCGNPNAQAILREAEAIWRRLCSYGGPEEQAPSMHRALTLFHAIQAGDPLEAKRVYDEMSPESQHRIDLADKYGTMRPWLQSSDGSPTEGNGGLSQVTTHFLKQHAVCKRRVQEERSASAFQELGMACERLGRVEEACDAYGEAAERASDSNDTAILAFVEARILSLLSGPAGRR
jgi:hypothetical protein